MMSLTNRSGQRSRKDSVIAPTPRAHEDMYQTRVEVLDPLMRTGFMKLPMVATFPTRGLEDWERNRGEMKRELSLCCLFQKGRCNLGAKCHQIHADRTYVEDQRKAAVNAVTCCAHCGDEASKSESVQRALARAFPSGRVLVAMPDGNVERVAVERLAWTQRLQTTLEAHSSTPLVIPLSRVCRLHQQGCCKYSSHCKNFHICSKIAFNSLAKEETSTQAPSETWTMSHEGTPKSFVARRGSNTPPPLDLTQVPRLNDAIKASPPSPLSEEKVLEWAADLVFSPSRLNTQVVSFEFQEYHPLFTPARLSA